MVDEREEEDVPIEVRDEGDCLSIEFHSGFGWSTKCYISDEDASQLVITLQNKINARF